jgi:hypothetical protein
MERDRTRMRVVGEGPGRKVEQAVRDMSGRRGMKRWIRRRHLKLISLDLNAHTPALTINALVL